MSDPFIAEVRIVALNFAPRGWAFCDGQFLSIAQNTALFSLIGTTYGGDGRTTMQLPDLRERMPMHPGIGPGLTDRRLGQRVGADTVALTEAEMPAHNHVVMANRGRANHPEPSDHALARGPQIYTAEGSAPVNMAAETIATDGGGGEHPNQPPQLNLNFVIALFGIFPVRG